MAQVGKGGSRCGDTVRRRVGAGLTRRLGLSAPGAVTAMLVMAVLVFGGIGLASALGSGEVFVERRAASETMPVVSGPTAETEPDATAPAGELPQTTEPDATSSVTVHVDGAVLAPGVYRLKESAPRVNDAVAAAGGLSPDAQTDAVNLAALIEDGSKVLIPREGEQVQDAVEVVVSGSSEGGTAAVTSSLSGGSGLVDINTADVAELDTLPGVGEATARAIVEDREAHGRFSSIDDLMRVSGIGEKKLEKLRGRIRV